MRILTEPDGIRLAVTDRDDGNLGLHAGPDPAAAQARRRRVERTLGVAAGRLLFLEQVHGTAVAAADEAPTIPAESAPSRERELAPIADAALTRTGRPLVVLTADCLPVLFATEDPSLAAVAHAGRRGLLDGILPRVLEALAAAGAERIRAWIGPGVCGSCYEVPESLAAEAEAILPGIAARTAWGTASLDLPGAARTQLTATAERLGLRLGISSELSACTLEDPDQFSHRRAPGEGRLAAILVPQPRSEPPARTQPQAQPHPDGVDAAPHRRDHEQQRGGHRR